MPFEEEQKQSITKILSFFMNRTVKNLRILNNTSCNLIIYQHENVVV